MLCVPVFCETWCSVTRSLREEDNEQQQILDSIHFDTLGQWNLFQNGQVLTWFEQQHCDAPDAWLFTVGISQYFFQQYSSFQNFKYILSVPPFWLSKPSH